MSYGIGLQRVPHGRLAGLLRTACSQGVLHMAWCSWHSGL